MQHRGFTVVELTIIIVVMAILLALGMAGLRSSMVESRNDQRKTNAEILVRGLETYYLKPDNRYANTPRPGNRYPSLSDQMHAVGWERPGYTPTKVEGGYPGSWLTGVPARIVNKTRAMYWVQNNPWYGGQTTQTPPDHRAIVQADAQNTVDTIVYEAVQFHPADGWGGDRFGECLSPNDHCTSFNVYYKTENFDGSTTTHMLRSKHQ